MMKPDSSVSDLPPELDEVLDAFEAAWQQGPADIQNFVDGLPPHRRLSALVELAAIDMERRWTVDPEKLQEAGVSPRPGVAEYHRALPALSPEALKRLALDEFRCRHRWGDAPTVQEFLAEQPQWLGLRSKLLQVMEDFGDREEKPGRNLVRQSDQDVEPVDSDLSKGRRLGRFKILKKIGSGGFGVVYLAFDQVLKRQVALKIPSSVCVRDEIQRRFVREARIAASLDHPNIVTVFEVGTIGQRPFIVTEFCPGPDLARWMAARDQAVPVSVILSWMVHIAEADGFAHARGIVHRDLKPSNVLLALAGPSSPDDLVPLLTDFGLATLSDAALRETGSSVVMGSPLYMAPEQLQASDASGLRSDVYSLGAMLYEMTTGRVPSPGRTVVEVFDAIRNEPPPRLRTLRPDAPRDLETVCHKCLQKNPQDRYANASALASELRKIQHNQPIAARPLSIVQRCTRWLAEPAKVPFAGWVTVLVNAVVLLWVILNAVMVLVGWLDATGLDRGGILRDSASIGLVHCVGIAAGIAVVNGRGWALWIALPIAAACLLASLLLASGIGQPFGGFYKDPVFAVVTANSLFAVFLVETLAILAGLWAHTWRSGRQRP